MADDNVIYPILLREAVVVSEKVGTWVLYRVRDAKNLEHVVGYMMGRIEDFDRRRDRAQTASRKRHLAERVAAWSRALRLIQRIKRGPYARLCARLIQDFDRDPTYSGLRYVSDHEVEKVEKRAKEERRVGKLKAKPRRSSGRPRVTEVSSLDFKPCGECEGAGFFRR